MIDVADRTARFLGRKARTTERLHGGDLAEVLAINLNDGSRVVAKPGRTAKTEAGMLRAIRAAGVPAPKVLAEDDDILVLEFLPDDGSLSSAWESLGNSVRRLHSARGEKYGWHTDHAFSTVEIPNSTAPKWPEFWAERRLLPSAPLVGNSIARRLEKLAGRLNDILPANPPAALLHGDLWSGNILSSKGKITGLIDPACYYGHSEVDIAMLSLFGSPSSAFYQAYGEPDAGLETRQPVYQLWPALVHLRLFGQGYSGMVDRMLRSQGV